MKHPSFLTAVSQPYPHRTSVHSHMQSTAYHYNAILNAKSYLNNSRPNNKVSLDIFSNKRTKNLNKQRISQNKKLLKSLIEIQRNYSLYGCKNQTTLTPEVWNSHPFNKTRRSSLQCKLQPISKQKTLKNPFRQKMSKLKISEQNLKLFEKISTTQSSFANKKQMKQWDQKIKYLGSFLQSTRSKQSSQSLKNQFFSTFIKMRESTNLQSNTIRLQPRSLITNSQTRTLKNSKRLFTQQNESSMKKSLRIKEHKKYNQASRRRMMTEDASGYQKNNLYSQNSELEQ